MNVEDTYDLYGIRKALNVTDLERDGLLLFALAALIGGGVLVGQALVRDGVGQRGRPADLARDGRRPTRSRSAHSSSPSSIASVVGAVTTVGVAVALSSRFPLGTARDYDLDVGTHADWVVLGIAVGRRCSPRCWRSPRSPRGGGSTRPRARHRAPVVRRSRRAHR